jgi:hypothetical protein
VTHSVEPPLLRFMRQLRKVDMTSDLESAFAETAGTTKQYLWQLTGDEEPNPRIKLAFAIVAASRRFGDRYGVSPLTLEDLIVGRLKAVNADETPDTVNVLVNGKLYHRRVDEFGRIVICDANEEVVWIEDSAPTERRISKIPALEVQPKRSRRH